MKDLSIIIPVLNEIEYIDKLIETVLVDDGVDKELLLVDAMSTDGTTERVRQYAVEDERIIHVENKEKFVSQGFNKALPLSSGKYVALIGAHAEYSKNYFKKGVEILDTNKADAVGGILNQLGKSWQAKVISKVMSSKFGVGNTPFRTERKDMYVDSAAFALYRKEIFSSIGGFDTELIRNQDDEFHYRLNAAGFKFFMSNEMESWYYVRKDLSKLYKQYYQYGLYKPLVLKKVPTGVKLRHLIPFGFTMYLITLLPLLFISKAFILPLVCYLLIITFQAGGIANNLREFLYAIVVFPTLHFAYGSGFLVGLKKVI